MPARAPESSREHHLGAIRIAPSRRMTSPLSIVVLEDVPHERRVFVRLAEPRRKRHLLRQRLPRRLGQRRQEWGVERSGRNRHHADAHARELARDRQRHADDAALRRRVGGLADLAVECRHRGGVHDHAALAVLAGRVLGHRLGREPNHVEGADQVDGDDAREVRQRLHAFLAEHAFGRDDAGRVHQAVDPAEGRGGFVDGALGVGLGRHIGLDEPRLRAVRRRLGPARVRVEVDDDAHCRRRRPPGPRWPSPGPRLRPSRAPSGREAASRGFYMHRPRRLCVRYPVGVPSQGNSRRYP